MGAWCISGSRTYIPISVYSVQEVAVAVKEKTSIYVDRELWRKFKRYASRRGMDMSSLLEDLIREGLVEESLDGVLLELAGSEDYEVDFEPSSPGRSS